MTVLVHQLDKPIGLPAGQTQEDIADVSALLERVRNRDVTAVVLGATVEGPVRLAQRLRAVDEGLPIVVLTPRDRVDRVERVAEHASLVGGPLSFLRADDPAALTAHLATLGARDPSAPRTAADGVSPAQYLDGILEGPTGVATVDPKGMLLSANQRACELLGVNEQLALGVSLENHMPTEAWLTVKEVLATRTPRRITLPHGDGSARDLEVHASVDVVARSRALVLVLVDVTERREAAEALVRKEQLQLDLLSMISHDIRAPLGVIVGAMNELGNKDVGEINDEQKFLLNLVRKSVERLTRLASNIVYLGRMESGKADITRRKVDLRVVVKHVSDELQRIDAGSTILIEQELPAEPIEANVDSERISQVLVNLLSNAVKFAKKKVRVVLRSEGPEGDVEIEVTDDGSGIPENAIGHIFERFSRVDAPKSGTGLGLAIVRGIMQTHGGSVRAVNLKALDPKQTGARLTVRFPRRA